MSHADVIHCQHCTDIIHLVAGLRKQIRFNLTWTLPVLTWRIFAESSQVDPRSDLGQTRPALDDWVIFLLWMAALQVVCSAGNDPQWRKSTTIGHQWTASQSMLSGILQRINGDSTGKNPAWYEHWFSPSPPEIDRFAVSYEHQQRASLQLRSPAILNDCSGNDEKATARYYEQNPDLDSVLHITGSISRSMNLTPMSNKQLLPNLGQI